MERGYVTVLDYSTGKTHIYQYYLAHNYTLEEFIVDRGHDLHLVKWMATDTIKFQIH